MNGQRSDGYGTAWTEPGQGATFAELYAYIVNDRAERVCKGLLLHYAKRFDPGVDVDAWTRRTNLRLTGAPLTSTDLENIAKCK
jgi:hypothetical protein